MSEKKTARLGSIEIDETDPLSIVNLPIDWATTFKLSKSAKALRLLQDKQGNIIGFPVVLTDASGSILKANNASPTVFKKASTATVGYTNIWVPGSGKKCRVFGAVLCLTKEAACAGALAIGLYDGAANVPIMYADISAVALVAIGIPVVVPFSFGGNGYLSIAKDNPITLGLSGALTAGLLSGTVWGQEE